MKKEFKISQMIALEGIEYHYDLHNDYDLVECIHNQDGSSVELLFTKTKGDWVKESDPSNIKIIFSALHYFKISEDFSKNFSKNIEDIGYKPSEDFDYDFLVPEEQADESFHLVFMFENNGYIRVFADEVKIVTPSEGHQN